jgi:hypothetical protein
MRKVILLLLALAAYPFAAITSVTLPNEDINGVDTPQVVWVDQNFDSLKVKQNKVIDTVNGLQGGTAAFTHLTASLPVFTNSSKRLTSNAMTGTGSVMMSVSPTTTGTLTGAAAAFSGNVVVNAFTTIGSNGQIVMSREGIVLNALAGDAYISFRNGSNVNSWDFGRDNGAMEIHAGTNTGTASHLRIQNAFGSATPGLIVDTENNRVGINDASPSVALDVGGAGIFTGTVTTDSLISPKFYEEGTFTATFTGMTTTVTGTARYVRIGKQVTICWPTLSGTSNSTSGAVTGLPAGIAPARPQVFPIPGQLIDNGNYVGTGLTPFVQVVSGGLNLGYTTDGSTASAVGGFFTASGTKGLNSFTLTYTLQ